MKLDRYVLSANAGYTTFEFTSEGKKGKIIKKIVFERTSTPFIFNLAFGDSCIKTGQLDDLVITDNGDTEKVLATIVDAVTIFLSRYSGAAVYATGSTASRTRLYRIGISKHFDDFHLEYDIYGEIEKQLFEPFRKNKNYVGFVVSKKIVNL